MEADADADASDLESEAGAGGDGARREAAAMARAEALEKELAAVREQLRATQQTARERMREVDRLKGLREDLAAANEAVARSKDQVKRLAGDKEALVERLQNAQAAEREAQTEARRATADAAGARKDLAKTREELEWERKFRAGQEKAKDRLTRTVQTLQNQLKQQTEFAGVAQKNLVDEKKEVKRERAQRLIDVHKLKATQDERDDLRALAEKKVAEAEIALRSAEHMRKQLEPLRQSLQTFERLAQDDAAQIEEQGSQLAEAAANTERLQATIARKTDEIELLTRRLEKANKEQSALRAQVFRLLKTHPELATFVPQVAHSSLSGAITARLGAAGAQPRQRDAESSPGAARTAKEPQGDVMLTTNTDADEEAHNCAVRFSLLLDDCLEQLDDKPRTAFERLVMPEIPGNSRPQEPPEYAGIPPARKAPRRRSPGSLPTKLHEHGAKFVGHGLGIRKDAAAVPVVSLRKRCDEIVRGRS